MDEFNTIVERSERNTVFLNQKAKRRLPLISMQSDAQNQSPSVIQSDDEPLLVHWFAKARTASETNGAKFVESTKTGQIPRLEGLIGAVAFPIFVPDGVQVLGKVLISTRPLDLYNVPSFTGSESESILVMQYRQSEVPNVYISINYRDDAPWISSLPAVTSGVYSDTRLYITVSVPDPRMSVSGPSLGLAAYLAGACLTPPFVWSAEVGPGPNSGVVPIQVDHTPEKLSLCMTLGVPLVTVPNQRLMEVVTQSRVTYTSPTETVFGYVKPGCNLVFVADVASAVAVANKAVISFKGVAPTRGVNPEQAPSAKRERRVDSSTSGAAVVAQLQLSKWPLLLVQSINRFSFTDPSAPMTVREFAETITERATALSAPKAREYLERYWPTYDVWIVNTDNNKLLNEVIDLMPRIVAPALQGGIGMDTSSVLGKIRSAVVSETVRSRILEKLRNIVDQASKLDSMALPGAKAQVAMTKKEKAKLRKARKDEALGKAKGPATQSSTKAKKPIVYLRVEKNVLKNLKNLAVKAEGAGRADIAEKIQAAIAGGAITPIQYDTWIKMNFEPIVVESDDDDDEDLNVTVPARPQQMVPIPRVPTEVPVRRSNANSNNTGRWAIDVDADVVDF